MPQQNGAVAANYPEPASHALSWRPRRWTAVLLVISAAFAAWTFSPVWWSQVGQDANVYYAAGNVSRQGGDVYNPGQLFAEEDRLYGAPHPGAGGFSHTTFANPPLFAAALKLIAPLPKTVFHLLWLSITAAGGVIALLALLEAMRWRGRSLPLVFLMTCSPMLLALFVGNISTLLLLSWSTGLLLWTRQRPVLAGAALSVCWLKPSVGLPIAAALVLAAPAAQIGPRIKAAIGLTAATTGLLVLQTVITGTNALASWGGALFGYASALNSSQGVTVFSTNMSGLASLPALWLGSLSTPVSMGLSMLVLAAILLIALRFGDLMMGLRETPLLGLAMAQAVALGLCPYLHFNDLVLAAMPLLLVASMPLNVLSRVTLVLWAVASPARLVLSVLLAGIAPRVDYAGLPSTGILLITLTFASLCAALPPRTRAERGHAAVRGGVT